MLGFRAHSIHEISAIDQDLEVKSSTDDYKKWFQLEYSLLEPNELVKDFEILNVVKLDKLHAAIIEERTQLSSPTIPLADGFCHNCRKTFDNWPIVGRSSRMTHKSSPSDFPDEKGWEIAVA
ncbi:hypothetical protein BLS_009287 [Venturia inaequalis]|uniref:Uncharacterized protein n=1 Tax=Venturia inaequalis TaxID=5025 RepID=A0A8H3VRC6_VENIN|nr:hypothetical protein BLS_009287 [Venturia inaequalis]KAE9992167.1 hypothetical protein EG327_009901 [Venturia inaequalis]